MDMDNFDAPKAGEEMQDVPLTDAPLAEDKPATAATSPGRQLQVLGSRQVTSWSGQAKS